MKPLILRWNGTSIANLEYPDGTLQNVLGSPSNGLQELISFGHQNGLDMHVEGGTQPVETPGAGGSLVYHLHVPIAFPSMQGRKFTTGAVTFNFTSNVGAQDCVTFNSCMLGDIDIAGQIVNKGTGHTVVLNPTIPTPIDTWMTTIVDSKLRILAIVGSEHGEGNAVHIRNSTGALTNTIIDFPEINGGYHGIFMEDGPHSIARNHWFLPHIHSQRVCSIRAGCSSRQNIYFVNAEPGPIGIGIKTAGSKDQFFGCANPSFGGLSYAIYCEPSAMNNRFQGDWIGPIKNDHPSNIILQL